MTHTASMQAKRADRSLRRQTPATPPIGLRTGLLDDVRRELNANDDPSLYGLFRQAHERQNGWDDREHREFWITHLSFWPAKRGNRSNLEGLAFALAVGLADGFTLEEILSELRGRKRKHLRGAISLASLMHEAIIRPPAPPGMPESQTLDAGTAVFGPAHPDVVAASQRWRLPRVFIQDDRGCEEALLPPPGAGFINLPAQLPAACLDPIGRASVAAFDEVTAALGRLRARRGFQPLREMVAAAVAAGPIDP